jgi:hypothetical protein
MPAQRLATTVSRGIGQQVKQAIRMSLHDCGMLAGVVVGGYQRIQQCMCGVIWWSKSTWAETSR